MMKTKASECLKEPMLQVLTRVINEISDQFKILNQLVEEKAGRKLNLQIVNILQVTENYWRIKVKGNSFTGRETKEEFKLVWWEHTCPANFHLLQWGRVAFGPGYNFIYGGVVEPNAEYIAKELAIYTHHEQIPGVLSRI
jgi:hypothetical protein